MEEVRVLSDHQYTNLISGATTPPLARSPPNISVIDFYDFYLLAPVPEHQMSNTGTHTFSDTTCHDLLQNTHFTRPQSPLLHLSDIPSSSTPGTPDSMTLRSHEIDDKTSYRWEVCDRCNGCCFSRTTILKQASQDQNHGLGQPGAPIHTHAFRQT